MHSLCCLAELDQAQQLRRKTFASAFRSDPTMANSSLFFVVPQMADAMSQAWCVTPAPVWPSILRTANADVLAAFAAISADRDATQTLLSGVRRVIRSVQTMSRLAMTRLTLRRWAQGRRGRRERLPTDVCNLVLEFAGTPGHFAPLVGLMRPDRMIQVRASFYSLRMYACLVRLCESLRGTSKGKVAIRLYYITFYTTTLHCIQI